MAGTPFQFTNWVEGLNSDVSPLGVPENGFYVQSNCITSYKKGAVLKRPGYEKISTTLESGKSITGLHNFRQSASTQKMLTTVDDATSDDTQLFYKTSSGAWTELTDAETAWVNKAGINVEFEDFIGYCFMVGYGATDGFIAPRTLTGTTFGTTNTTSMPNAKYIRRYRDRLYIANCDISGTTYPYRVYYSSVPSGSTISWTVATDFIDVDYSEEITGIAENWDRMIIFTEYSAYMYNQDEKKKVWDIGCSNYRTIKNYGAYMVWANRDGVWASQTGGAPMNIAQRVIDYIHFANMSNSFAEMIDEEYYLYLGNVTVNGISYANCAIVFNFPTATWRVEEYFDSMTVFAKYFNSGEDYLYMGASDGDVHRRGKYTDTTILSTDAGNSITTLFYSGLLSFNSPEIEKEITKAIFYADRAQGLFLKARIVDRNVESLNEFKPLGYLKKYINEFEVNPPKGNFIQIMGTDTGKMPYWSLLGATLHIVADKIVK